MFRRVSLVARYFEDLTACQDYRCPGLAKTSNGVVGQELQSINKALVASRAAMADAVPTEPVAVFKKRGARAQQVVRKKVATPPDGPTDSDDLSDGEHGRQTKKRRTGVVLNAPESRKVDLDSLKATQFAADKSQTIEAASDATRHSDWFEDKAGDGKALAGQDADGRQKRPDGGNDGSYKGAAGYQSFIQKNANAPDRKFGPMKAAATNIRTITVTDFAPDVCKDYKQTGFCGFGDSCKFLHAREDYKQGWQLDRDWDINAKGKKAGAKEANNEADDEAALEKIPFACVICKKSYSSPIVTTCGHYFCESCALQRYKKTSTCAACGAGTGGVFNGARNLRKLLDRKKEREQQKKGEQQKEDG